jgi:hypothetical protein
MTITNPRDEGRDQVDQSMMAWRVHEFGPPVRVPEILAPLFPEILALLS